MREQGAIRILPPHCQCRRLISIFSIPHTCIPWSYFPDCSHQVFVIENRPPTMIGVGYGSSGDSLSLLGISCHLKVSRQFIDPRFQSGPVLYFAVFSSMMSHTGTTEVFGTVKGWSNGGSQPGTTSMCVSRNTITWLFTRSAPSVRHLIRPSDSSDRTARTLGRFQDSTSLAIGEASLLSSMTIISSRVSTGVRNSTVLSVVCKRLSTSFLKHMTMLTVIVSG
mmetsp:Transcript_42837/g.83964  ORF Transcript_42837/g.83964 Transcript_42837/m.83964 type:complete len:223 (-) Transcript_42837:206-874(-)